METIFNIGSVISTTAALVIGVITLITKEELVRNVVTIVWLLLFATSIASPTLRAHETLMFLNISLVIILGVWWTFSKHLVPVLVLGALSIGLTSCSETSSRSGSMSYLNKMGTVEILQNTIILGSRGKPILMYGPNANSIHKKELAALAKLSKYYDVMPVPPDYISTIIAKTVLELEPTKEDHDQATIDYTKNLIKEQQSNPPNG